MNTKDFEHSVVALSPRVFRMIARMLADEEKAKDAVQEIMLKLWKNRKTLVNHPNINGFVFLTAKNYCLDLLRKSQPFMTSDDTILRGLSATVEDQSLEYRELKNNILSILRALPVQQSEVLIRRDLDGLEFDEISMVMDLKVEHVRVLLSRARKKVAEQLKTAYCYE